MTENQVTHPTRQQCQKGAIVRILKEVDTQVIRQEIGKIATIVKCEQTSRRADGPYRIDLDFGEGIRGEVLEVNDLELVSEAVDAKPEEPPLAPSVVQDVQDTKAEIEKIDREVADLEHRISILESPPAIPDDEKPVTPAQLADAIAFSEKRRREEAAAQIAAIPDESRFVTTKQLADSIAALMATFKAQAKQ